MDALGAPQFRKITFRGPPGLYRWTLRVRLDASLTLKLNLVPPIGVVVKQADLAALENKMIYTEWPTAVLRRLVHHILTSKTLRKSLKMMPDDVFGLYEVIKDSITNQGLQAASISRVKDGRTFLLLHDLKDIGLGTTKATLSKNPGQGLYELARQAAVLENRPPPVYISATAPYPVYDSDGRLIRARLREALTGGTAASPGENSGWAVWQRFERITRTGMTEEEKQKLAEEKAKRAKSVKEAQERKKAARKAAPKAIRGDADESEISDS
ncbi:hypothetical protein BMF94_5269 [Rhodotorula taiwanensis]|uniref:Uncharacterized protein n=1 Tax=Rhodotorula taiwanensis TaxID=741276 RepID=A0A2S5B4H9_9BASI|nr:hypothetical protein BMF94_5269 [Rhodotorula taiwanensis]